MNGHLQFQGDGLDFWSRFVQKHWEQEPALLASESSRHLPRIEPDELFRAVLTCIEDFCRGGLQKVRFYVEGAAVDILGGQHQALLPRPEDISFSSYNNRMVHSGFKDYALIIADWHQFDRSLWDRILISIAGLIDLVGITGARMDTQIFVGTYKVTPFGVHVDSTSAFHFPVIGSKTMRFWQHAFGASTPTLQRSYFYDRYLGDSSAITANPGEVIYWPSGYWHVGESDGTFSATWGLGYWIGESVRERAVRTAMRILEESNHRAQIILPRTAAIVAANQNPGEDIVRDLISAMSKDRFAQSITETWLRHYSAYGFLRVPALLDAFHLTSTDRLRKKATFRILASRISPELICVASAGHSCMFRYNPAICTVIEALNQDIPVTIKELQNIDQGGILDALVTFILQSGAIVKDNP